MKPNPKLQWTARSTSRKNDCCGCHNGQGIWRHPLDRLYWLCDTCFSNTALIVDTTITFTASGTPANQINIGATSLIREHE